MFYRLGTFLARHARLVLGLSVVFVAASAVLGIGAFGKLQDNGFDDPSSDSTQAKILLYENFGGESNIIFLVESRAGNVDEAAATRSGEELTSRLMTDPRLSQVTSYWTEQAPGLRSTNGRYALILARDDGDGVIDDYSGVEDAAITVKIGGEQGTDVGAQVGKDLALAESIAVPLTLILLVIAFGSMVSALLPLGIAVIAIFATFAELSLLTRVTDVSIFAINITTALGLGLGIDYALLMVSRFREELAGGGSVTQAVARTTATAGRTIAFSALTVAAALAAMLVFPVYFLKSFAYAGVGVTAFAALSALIVLPAGLALLGQRVNAGRVPGISPDRSPEAPFWGRLARLVMRRPGRRRTARDRRAPGDVGPLAARLLRDPGRARAPREQPGASGRRRPAGRFRDAAQRDRGTRHPVAGGRGGASVRGRARTARRGAPGHGHHVGRHHPPAAEHRLRQCLRSRTDPGRSGTRRAAPRRRRRPGGRRHGRADRRQGGDLLVALARRPHHPADHAGVALPVHRQRGAADSRGRRKRTHPRRHPRRHGLDLPGRPSFRSARLHPGAHQHLDAGAALLHRLRPVDGL